MSKINKLMIGLSAGLLTAAILLTSAKSSESEFSTDIYRQVATDTITDAGADTIVLGANLFSFWKYNHVIKGDQLSGTIDILATIQERNSFNSDIWYNVDTLSVLTNGGVIRLTGDVFGVSQRVILKGSGTQSSVYTLQTILKKPY
jgi:hypothetical protein